MAQKDNILQELNELESSLAGQFPQNTYAVPAGYFEGLAGQVLNRIKAMEAATASEELSYLSPMLNDLSKEMPYKVPAGYFEDTAATILNVVRDDSENAKEELESISPLLSGLKKEMPYEVPAGYFQNLNTAAPADKSAKVVSISRKWFRYAAAAIAVGILATTGIIIINNRNNPEKSLARLEKKIEKDIEKSSDNELREFIQYTDAGNDLAINEPKEEIKAMLKDVSESELQNFLEDIADPEIAENESSSMP
jgi:hypothetical protein